MPGEDTSATSSTGAVDADPNASHEPRSLTLGEHLLAFFQELLVVVLGAVIVASLIRALVGQMFLIPSSSMENTLSIEDRVVVEKLSSIKRGQVVVFEDPGGWLTGASIQERGPIGKALEFVGVLPDTATEHLIKRAIGLPGDHVVCCDARGRITVNGQALDESSYLSVAPDGTKTRPSSIKFDVVVPVNRVFVLGDNRSASRDSRCHLNDVQVGAARGENAFVSENLVVGRGIAVVWPLGAIRRLKMPTTFANLPSGTIPAPARPVVNAGPEANC